MPSLTGRRAERRVLDELLESVRAGHSWAARRDIPLCSPTTAYTGAPTASVVVLGPCDGDGKVSVLNQAFRKSRKNARLTVVVYPSQLFTGTREALDRWLSIGADHLRLDNRYRARYEWAPNRF